MMMNCTQFQNDLLETILRREPVSAELVIHGECCDVAACRAAWEEHCRLAPAIQAWQSREALLVVPELTVPVPASMIDLPIAPVRAAAPVGPTSRLKGWLTVGIASLVLLSLFLVPGPAPDERVVEQPLPTEVPGILEPAANTPRIASQSDRPDHDQHDIGEGDTAIRELSQTYVGWLQDSTGQITETVSFVVVDGTQEERSHSERPGWVESLEQRWQPLEKSLQETFRSLLDVGTSDMGNAS